MRNNQPVTDKEYVLRDGAAIISRTDGKGLIVDCNEEFIEASGFTWDELIGKPHNMVRHPDMPSAAFHDFWDTLKRGRHGPAWSRIVEKMATSIGFARPRLHCPMDRVTVRSEPSQALMKSLKPKRYMQDYEMEKTFSSMRGAWYQEVGLQPSSSNLKA